MTLQMAGSTTSVGVSGMPRDRSAIPIPAYGLHRATGQARVIIHGRNVYLGRHGSPASWEKYRRLIADYLASGGAAPPSHAGRRAGAGRDGGISPPRRH